MLYQETLKPDKDVQMIVEQYRTGQFIPRPILYENYFYGTSRHQLFGVSLEDLSRNEASLIPRFISSGISFIESGKIAFFFFFLLILYFYRYFQIRK